MKIVIIRTLKTMFVFGLLLVFGEVDEWTLEGIINALFMVAHLHALGFAIWTVIIFCLIGLYEIIKNLKLKKSNGDLGHKMNKIQRLKQWYANVTKKQRNILWVFALLISAIPFVGWVFIAPWLIPLMLFLEYHRS